MLVNNTEKSSENCVTDMIEISQMKSSESLFGVSDWSSASLKLEYSTISLTQFNCIGVEASRGTGVCNSEKNDKGMSEKGVQSGSSLSTDSLFSVSDSETRTFAFFDIYFALRMRLSL